MVLKTKLKIPILSSKISPLLKKLYYLFVFPIKAILAIKKDWFLRTKSIMILLLISGIFTLCSALFQYLYQTESDVAFQETLRRVFLSFSFLRFFLKIDLEYFFWTLFQFLSDVCHFCDSFCVYRWNVSNCDQSVLFCSLLARWEIRIAYRASNF